MRLALIIEYEGTEYHGFQYQANAPSIQEELEKAVGRFTGEKSRVRGAGRTDAGVHAKGQVVAFDTTARHSPETFMRGLNYYLPDDIAVKAAYRTSGDFDPRRMATRRRYRYTFDCGPTRSPLSRRTAYRIGQELNVRKMQRSAGWFEGVHDYARFAGPLSGTRAGTVRTIYEAKIRRDGDMMYFEVEGNAFLPQQVRRMSGALVDVGRGRLGHAEIKSMINGEPGDVVARTLPSTGLCLLNVSYAHFPPQDGESDGHLH